MINEIDFPILAGVIGSVLHVVSGPDHLVAVAPFAIEEKKKAWKIGLTWGVGHLAGMLIIGLLVLIFKEIIPFEAISHHSEQSVGFILIGLGIWILYKAYKKQYPHSHTHLHTDANIHTHHHGHPHSHAQKEEKRSFFMTFLVGILHGFAGVAHLIAFIPIIGFSSAFGAAKYLVGFAIGTLLAMTIFTFIIGRFTILTKADTNNKILQILRLISAFAAIVVGIYWILSN